MQPYAKKVQSHLQHSCQHRFTADPRALSSLCVRLRIPLYRPPLGLPSRSPQERPTSPSTSAGRSSWTSTSSERRYARFALLSSPVSPGETLLEGQRCFPVRSELRTDVATCFCLSCPPISIRQLSIYPRSQPEIVLVETYSPLQSHIAVGREAATGVFQSVRDETQKVVSKWINVERKLSGESTAFLHIKGARCLVGWERIESLNGPR